MCSCASLIMWSLRGAGFKVSENRVHESLCFKRHERIGSLLQPDKVRDEGCLLQRRVGLYAHKKV